MPDREYEMREAQEFQRQLRDVEKAPLADRKEAAKAWGQSLTDHGRDDHPSVVAERIGWLLDGNYGYGAMQAARRIADNSRMNRVAALSIMIAALEWMCPGKMAVAAWKKLSAPQKAKLEKAIKAEIDSYLKDKE
jgi:hypothetical protein